MLRSLQTLRDSATDSCILAAADGRLALAGGGGGDYYTPWHWHDCLMILLPRTGAVEFHDETRQAATWLSQDRFAVVPQTLFHQTACRRADNDHLAIYVTDDQLTGIERELGSLGRIRARLSAPAFFAISPEMRSLLRLCRQPLPLDRAAQSAGAHLAAALLFNCLSRIEHGEQLPASIPGTHGDMLVSEVKSYIADDLATDLSLDAIADMFGVSRRHVTRLFRDKTGMTIGEFHDRARVDQARELLRATDLPIGEIAWRVGLDSGSALARMMRRVAGITPTAARMMARSDKH